jgi:hypothetical protein
MANAKPVYDYGVYSTFDGRVGSHIITVPATTARIGPGGNNLLTAIFVGYDWPEK